MAQRKAQLQAECEIKIAARKAAAAKQEEEEEDDEGLNYASKLCLCNCFLHCML